MKDSSGPFFHTDQTTEMVTFFFLLKKSNFSLSIFERKSIICIRYIYHICNIISFSGGVLISKYHISLKNYILLPIEVLSLLPKFKISQYLQIVKEIELDSIQENFNLCSYSIAYGWISLAMSSRVQKTKQGIRSGSLMPKLIHLKKLRLFSFQSLAGWLNY